MREPTLFTEQFGERVRERRRKLRMSMDDLARRLEMSKSGLWQIEKGISVAGINTLLRLCFVLGISPNKLILGREKFE